MDSTQSQRSRIGVCSWSLQPANIADLEAALRRLGIGACQLALVPLVEEPQGWVNAVSRLNAAGIDVVTGMLAMAGEDYSTLESIRKTGGVVNDDRWDENRERADRVAAMAAELDIGLVTFHAGFMPHDASDPRRKTLLDRLTAVATVFASRNIELALETGQESAETLEKVLNDLDAPNLGVNFDPANMILYGMGDPVEALNRLSPHVRQIHIKDATPTETPGTWGTEVPVGEGAVNWSAFFDAALKLPLTVDFVIEREAGESRQEDIAGAMQFVERQLAMRNVH